MKNNLRFLKPLLLFWLLMLLSQSNYAQRVITGNVADQQGEPIPGATILIKGTTVGTVSDIYGAYTLSVPLGKDTLVFSFIGMTTIEKPITGNVVNCTLESGYQQLDEILVIGYGTMRKEDKTGAVAQVKAEELNGGVITDPIQAMQAKAAGVLITKKGGDPNSGFKVQIRGASGFDSDTQPLYVVDGVPGVDPTTIAPEDIESFNILKDAASTAIYGSRGSNGVILITTKKGKLMKKGEKSVSNINVNSKVSIDRVAKTLDLLSADQIRAHAQALLAKGQVAHPNWTIDSIFNDGGANTDWQDEIYRIGMTTSNNINFSGGSEKGSYYASLTHANWEGVMKGTSKERTIGKINLLHKGLNDRLTLSGSISGTFENNDYENYSGWGKDDIIYQAISRNPTDPVYNPDGTYYKAQREFNYENPISIINEVENTREAKRFLGNFKTDLEIIKGLTGSVNLAYTSDDEASSYFRPKGLYASADVGHAKKEYKNTDNKLIEITTNYLKTFNQSHNVNGLLGYSWQQNVHSGFFAKGDDAQSDYIQSNDLATLADVKHGDIDSWKSQWTLIGLFFRAQYNFQSKYYLSGSIRRDGSSKFGDNNKWGWFPTAAAGWNLDREAFLEDVEWLNQLKLRISYGKSGNQAIGEYRSRVAWQTSGLGINPESGQPVVTYEQAWNANPDLKWESTYEINAGIDFAFWESKLSGSIEVYKKNTKDLLGKYTVPSPPNFSTTTFANAGELENKGIELYLQYYVIQSSKVSWKTSINAAHNQSKMLDLGEFFNEIDGVRKEGYISGRGLVGEENYVTGIMVGEEIGSFYLPVYVVTKNGAFVYKSKTGGYTDIVSDAQREIVGNAAPDLELGWSNSLTLFKNWNIDLSFRAMIGNDVYNATRMFFDYPGLIPELNALTDALDWYEEGRTTTQTIADIYVEDASFLKLDYASLGYSFNLEKAKWIQKLNIYVAANNLFTLTGYSGVDPETTIEGLSYGIDQYNVYPKTRTLTFGINATF